MKITRHRQLVGLGVAAGSALAAAFIPLAGVPIAQAEPFFPEPPCIVTETGLCVPDTVWPIPAGGHLPIGHHPIDPLPPPVIGQPINPAPPVEPPPPVHPLPPPVEHPAPPPVSGPPEVITCIVNEGCFLHPGPTPISHIPVDPSPAAAGDGGTVAPDTVGADDAAGAAAHHDGLFADLLAFLHL